MTLHLVVTVDQNDADYLSKVTLISPANLDRLRPVFEAIKSFKPYKGKSGSDTEFTHRSNWPSGGDYSPRLDLGEKFPQDIYPELGEELCEFFTEEFAPYSEHGFHTVTDVYVLHVSREETLLMKS